MAKKPIIAKLSDERVLIFNRDGISRLNAKGYGELSDNFLSLSLVESLYLVYKNWIKVKSKKDRFYLLRNYLTMHII